MSHLPLIYRQILSEERFSGMMSPAPPRCLSCKNCQLSGERKGPTKKGKCCYFRPFLPNYLVGAILVHGEKQAVSVIRRLIERRDFVFPVGLCPPPWYQVAYRAYIEDGERSKEQDLLCPFYAMESGKCTVWDFRDAVCASYFCEYESQGNRSQWKKWEQELSELQTDLLSEALYAMGWLPAEFEHQLTMASGKEALGQGDSFGLQGGTYKEQWQEYVGREEEFFVGCFERLGWR